MKPQSKKFHILALLLSVLFSIGLSTTCHYTCLTCFAENYYSCDTCPPNRGISPDNDISFANMCYCEDEADEDQFGICQASNSYNYSVKAAVAVFIALSLLMALMQTCLRANRYFLVKVIEDVQEVSLIVFLNLYFPQQFDIFLTKLYRFNISSYMFSVMADGSLFEIEEGNYSSADGSDIYGKYKLLLKSSNFFANQFTWLLVVLIGAGVGLMLKLYRDSIISAPSKVDAIKQTQSSNKVQEESLANMTNGMSSVENNNVKLTSSTDHSVSARNPYEPNFSNLLIKSGNVFFCNFIITFCYLSLFELNINLFTQIFHLKFDSGFSIVGGVLALAFLGAQGFALFFLWNKTSEELIKPSWMRDSSYSSLYHLIRTNFKTITKYFFFACIAKKVLISLFIVVFYEVPTNAVLAISSVQAVFLLLAIHCEPYTKRYLRLHFYLTEAMKLFLYISLINFIEKYEEYIKLIQITQVLFFMVAFIFGFHMFSILINLTIERQIYWWECKRKWERWGCCKSSDPKSDSTRRKRDNYLSGEKTRQVHDEQLLTVGYVHVRQIDPEQADKRSSEGILPSQKMRSKELEEIEVKSRTSSHSSLPGEPLTEAIFYVYHDPLQAERYPMDKRLAANNIKIEDESDVGFDFKVQKDSENADEGIRKRPRRKRRELFD